MSRSMFGVSIIKKFVPRNFAKSRALENPAVTRFVDKKLFDGDDLICLPKDNVIKVRKQLDAPDNMVLPSQVVDHFIEKSSFRWIMNFCICRDALSCKDYPTTLGCMFLGEAARGINPALGRPVSKDEALAHVRRCRDAGLVHFVGRSKLDTVWLKIGPGERLFTICSCCPCCCITRGIAIAPPLIGDKVHKMPGVTVSINENCKACGTCQAYCFANAIQMTKTGAVITDACRGCTRCVSICSNEAIEVKIENEGYVNETIRRLSQAVDVT